MPPYLVLLTAMLLAALVFVRIWDPLPVQSARLQVFDFYQQLKPREAGEPGVVIVDIDDPSLAAVGQWPWPRTVLAELADRLVGMGALVVGFDIFFVEPDRMSPPRLADRLTTLDRDARLLLKQQPDNDDVFADVIRRTGRVVLAQAPTTRPVGQEARPPLRKLAVAELGGDPRPYLLNYSDVVRGLPKLEQAAKGLGTVTEYPEADRRVRRVPLAVTVGSQIVPSLAIEVLRVATGQNTIAIKSNEAGIDSFVVSRLSIPTDGAGAKWVYFAPHDPRRYVSAKDVLDGADLRSRIQGKLVLVGTSAAGLIDIKETPIAAAMPGVEVHAQLIETLLGDQQLLRPNYSFGAELALLFAACMLIVLLTPVAGALVTLATGLLVIGQLAAASWFLYASKGVLLDVTYAAFGSFLVYALLVYAKYTREESGRKSVRKAFAQYLSPELIDRLAEHPEQLKLGGQLRHMSFMFADLRGFTSIAERSKADPEALTRLVNLFLTPMTDVIMARGGTIDKYMGDAVMAFWNAPLRDDQHASHACESALGMLAALERLNAELTAQNTPASGLPSRLEVGIGLNTGQCIVGNMGSTRRFNYTVLGDAVNLAARLESQSKNYGVSIVVGEETCRQASDFAMLELDLIAVKGKSEAARIYALIGDPAFAATDNFQTLLERHNSMLAAYRLQDWPAAHRSLLACRQQAPDLSKLYDLYRERIAYFEANPRVADWDGVFVAATK